MRNVNTWQAALAAFCEASPEVVALACEIEPALVLVVDAAYDGDQSVAFRLRLFSADERFASHVWVLPAKDARGLQDRGRVLMHFRPE